MTPTESVQSILGPMTSPAKVEAVIVAVLEAIREPSKEQVYAGYSVVQCAGLADRLAARHVSDIHRAMIDRLLEERAKGVGR